MSTIWVFDHIEDKNTLYRGKNCMKKFCNSIREHAKNIIDFEKRKIANKNRIKTVSTRKSMLYLSKKNTKV